jgi:hypothetical protein
MDQKLWSMELGEPHLYGSQNLLAGWDVDGATAGGLDNTSMTDLTLSSE